MLRYHTEFKTSVTAKEANNIISLSWPKLKLESD